MASQVAIFADTIAAMKKAVKRKSYDSDSDNSIDQLTNRGNKLRKKARYVHQGQLAAPTGPQVYKRTIEHAGYQREIISRKQPLIDEDGYEVDSDDDDERAQQAAISAAEFDPYADVKLEDLLVPLTAATDLPLHPTLSRPFTSKTLTELTRHAGEMVQKEKTSLWRIRHLLTKLSGDDTWIPAGSVETDHDITLFDDEPDRRREGRREKVISSEEADQVSPGTLASDDSGSATKTLNLEAEADKSTNGSLEVSKTIHEGPASGDVLMAGLSNEVAEAAGKPEGVESPENGTNRTPAPDPQAVEGVLKILSRLEAKPSPLPDSRTETLADQGEAVGDVDMDGGGEDQDDVPAPHRMRTRAQAQAASDSTTHQTRSPTPDYANESGIHPYFLAPVASRPDRNLGLPQFEAEEVRRLLQLYIQKQEEVCRGVQKLYDGLLRADRYRHLVMKWAKAEGHVGANRDMSDGEDWYDKEEWGLDEDLKKGEDEQEEDAATTAKKTRTRRQ